MALKSISSTDGKNWTIPDGAGNPLFQGPTLQEFRGELWGAWISTADDTENVPYLYKYNNGKMPSSTGSIGLKPAWRTIGRLGATTLDDRYYLAYRGATSGKYWIAVSPTPQFADTWSLINPGGIESPWAYSPTVCAFQGSLVVLGATEDNQLYYQVMSPSGTIESPWAKITNQKTIRAPALCVYKAELYLVHPAENGKECWWGKLSSKTGNWGSFSALAADGVATSVSMTVHSDSNLYFTFVVGDGSMGYYSYNSSGWTKQSINTTAKAEGSCGVGSLGGRLFVAYGQKSASSSISSKAMDYEGAVVRGGYTDSDEESLDSVYYEKQEAMQVARPRWMAATAPGHATLSTDPVAKPSTSWYSRLFCL